MQKFKYCFAALLYFASCGLAEVGVASRVFFGKKLWPNAIVYYDIDPYIRNNKLMYTSIVDSIAYMNAVTCVRWVQRYPWDDSVEGFVTFITIKDYVWQALCQADEVYRGVQQYIYLGKWCSSNLYYPSRQQLRSPVLHEMMHTLGFLHEHSRSDRDCYIFVTEPTRSSSESWWKYPADDPQYRTEFPYDYHSLHYPGGQLTAYAHDPNITLGRRDGNLSEWDIWRVQTEYCNRPSYCAVNQEECEAIRVTNQKNPNCTKFDNKTKPDTSTPLQGEVEE